MASHDRIYVSIKQAEGGERGNCNFKGFNGPQHCFGGVETLALRALHGSEKAERTAPSRALFLPQAFSTDRQSLGYTSLHQLANPMGWAPPCVIRTVYSVSRPRTMIRGYDYTVQCPRAHAHTRARARTQTLSLLMLLCKLLFNSTPTYFLCSIGYDGHVLYRPVPGDCCFSCCLCCALARLFLLFPGQL